MLQVVFDKAMAIYAQLFHFRQQLRLLEKSSNLVGQNPDMQNATMLVSQNKPHNISPNHLFLELKFVSHEHESNQHPPSVFFLVLRVSNHVTSVTDSP